MLFALILLQLRLRLCLQLLLLRYELHLTDLCWPVYVAVLRTSVGSSTSIACALMLWGPVQEPQQTLHSLDADWSYSAHQVSICPLSTIRDPCMSGNVTKVHVQPL
jgi:hypothetical protein